MKRVWAAWFILGAAGLGAWAQYPVPNVPPTTPPFFPPNASSSTAQNRPPNYPPVQGGAPIQNGGAPDADSANHGVARLSMMAGGVQVAHGNMGELAGAVMNAPLLTEDRVLTDASGRAEVQFDGANLVRVAGSTEVRMGDLQYKHYQVQIAQGLVTFRVLRDNDAQVEISTPTVAVHPLRQGIYRVSVSPEGLTEITVRAGEAEVASPTGSEPLRAGQMMISRGTVSDPEFRTMAAPAPDDWDRFNGERDRVFENDNAPGNVPPDIYGTENLGQYGRWVGDPQYGNVWVPNEGPDWAPYQDGRWTDVDYYGWTWVSYDPWGWAPYHYGRWFRGAYGWAWYPGAIGPRTYWSPALVGFFGWGTPGFGVSFGLGFGNIGWVPLAPFEAFHPWYGRGFGGGFAGVRSTAIVNNMNIASTYRNARVNGGVTSMRTGDFGRSAVSGNTMMRASAGDLSHASMMNGGVPIAASRESRNFSASPGAGNAQGMPRTSSNTRFFSASSSGFSRSGAGFSRSGAGFSRSGAGFANSGSGVARPAGTTAGAGGFAGGAASANGAGAWRRFDPGTSGSQRPGGGTTSFSGRTAGSQGNAGSPGYASRGQGFQNGGGQAGGGSQAVRIAPPIVNNRGASSAAPRSYAPSGGFGGPRSSGGGGGVRSAPSGGGHGGGRR